MSITPQIVSLSGGKDSTALLLMMLEHGEHVHSAVFFDTGWEFPQMYEHIENLERIIFPVPLIRVYPKEPFNFLLMHRCVYSKECRKKPRRIGYGWPSPLRRWCTARKSNRIWNYAKVIKNATQCIGYTSDEKHRVKRKGKNSLKSQAFRFPLVEYGVSESAALDYCRKCGFNWGGLYDHFRRVSCFCCPLQRLGELRNLRRHYPDLWRRMLVMDSNIKNNVGFRDYSTVHDLEARFAGEDTLLRLPILELCNARYF